MKQIIQSFSMGIMISVICIAAGYYLLPEEAPAESPALSEGEMITRLENAGYRVLTKAAGKAEKENVQTKVDTEAEQKEWILKIKKGMTLSKLAAALQKEGIIEDAEAFSEYMNTKNYSTRIQLGTFTFHEEMSYKEIAEMLTEK